jgi:ribonuclease P protein component
MPGFVLLVRPRDDGDSTIRVGYTVTKKIGGAVVRNRMKRRFERSPASCFRNGACRERIIY